LLWGGYSGELASWGVWTELPPDRSPVGTDDIFDVRPLM